jgi:hypothetical protein
VEIDGASEALFVLGEIDLEYEALELSFVWSGC